MTLCFALPMGSAIRELHISVARRPSNDGIQNGSYVFFLQSICRGKIHLALHGRIPPPFLGAKRVNYQVRSDEVVIPENGGVGGPPFGTPPTVPLFPNLKTWVQA